MEIERKFLVAKLPENLEQFPCSCIEQAYISTKPVIRVRRKDDRYILTCKGQGLLTREEYELFLSQEEYQNLLARAQGQIITKKRYRIPYLSHIIELDVFEGALTPLLIAEVEFETEQEAFAFQPPDWFGEEVTYDPSYTNAALSQKREESEVRPGRYRHFKGNEYEVLYTAYHSETQEPMVVYRAMYGERAVWVRPASMWNDTLTREGECFRRFTAIDALE